MALQDKSLECRDCGKGFVFSASEQAFYQTRGLVNEPQRCPTCRAQRRAQRNGETSGAREMHQVTCSECSGVAFVPFLPKNERPVYCSACFEAVRARA